MSLTAQVPPDRAVGNGTTGHLRHRLLERLKNADLISVCKLVAIGLLVSAAAAAAILVGEDVLLHLAPFVSHLNEAPLQFYQLN